MSETKPGTQPDPTLSFARIDLRGQYPSARELRDALPRGGTDIDAVLPIVTPIVEDVIARGAAAAVEYGQKFDGVTPDSVRVPAEVIAGAVDSLRPEVIAALKEAIHRVRAFHSTMVPAEHTVEVTPGARVTERFIPVQRVGLYVPGGKAVYPSSVIMNVVPAQEAGVDSLVVASPPQEDGWPHPTVLAAAHLLGVTEVWAVGGAQAVALLAYGGRDIAGTADAAESAGAELEPVDMITGPGNIFVTAAKRLCRSVAGIDSEAGPTEIAIIADDTADATEVAYDLISQAEHDPMAASVLITTSEQLADRVVAEMSRCYQVTRNAERVAEALQGPQSGVVLVDDEEMAIRVANAYAAEHLEIHTADSHAVAADITNAGAIFVGRYSPVPLGDYAAGSNHVLPTSGSARHASGLSTRTFLKAVHVIDYSKQALAEIADTVVTLADSEMLPAHGEAIRARFAAGSDASGASDVPDAAASAQITLADLPLRPELRGQSAYGAPQLRVSNRLNTNENPYPPSAAIIEQIQQEVTAVGEELNRYPDRDALELRRDLAAYVTRQTGVAVTTENLWAANGSNEVLQQLLQAFGGPGRRALGFVPSYSMHPLLAAGTHTEFITVQRREEDDFAIDRDAALEAIATHRPHVVFVTTPNNPTGNITSLEDLAALAEATRDVGGVLIVDEAYAEFSEAPSACELLERFPTSVVVSRTMSKAFDFAGARLGYFVAHPAFVEAVMLVRLPYHLSSLTQMAARVALAHSDDTLATVQSLADERVRVAAALRELGCRVIDSEANFIFFGSFDDSAAAWQQFLDNDVLIRDVGIPGWLRMSVGLPHENDAFLAAAERVIRGAEAASK